eukprot:3348916-Rhodomonas_salina.1
MLRLRLSRSRWTRIMMGLVCWTEEGIGEQGRRGGRSDLGGRGSQNSQRSGRGWGRGGSEGWGNRSG